MDAETNAASDPDGSGASNSTGGTWQGGGAAAGGPTTPPPETETEETFSAPVVSGHWIWAANPISGKVALIRATDLQVTTTEAGLAPTYLAALPSPAEDESGAVVLNTGSGDATVLRADRGVIDAHSVPVHRDANRLVVSPSGRWVIVWSDASLIENVDPTEGLQDVTVLDLSRSPVVGRRLSVGYRPNRVVIGAGEEQAYVVTEPGVSVLELDDDAVRVVRDVALSQHPGEAASARDVTVTPDGSLAFVRREQSSTLEVVSLAAGARTRRIELPGAVTDVDLSPDGSLALAVVRAASSGTGGTGGTGAAAGSAGTATSAGNGGIAGTSGNTAGSAGLVGNAGATGGDGQSGAPAENAGAGNGDGAGGQSGASGETAGATGVAGVDAGGATGSAGEGGAVAVGGEGGAAQEPPPRGESFVAVLPVPDIFEMPSAFVTVPIREVVGSVVIAPAGNVALLYTNATANDRVTILDLESLETRTVVVQAPVRAVLAAPDGKHAVALLAQAAQSQKQGGFSLIPLAERLPPKIVGTNVPPVSVAMGSAGALITISGRATGATRDDHGVYLARFPELSTEAIALASPPLSTALIPEAGVGFVAQSHPEGRITFLDLETSVPRTITGFELSSRVVQDD